MAFGVLSLTPLYFTDLYNYSPDLNGYYQSSNFAAGAVGLLLGMPLLQRCLRLRSILVLTNFSALVNGQIACKTTTLSRSHRAFPSR